MCHEIRRAMNSNVCYISQKCFKKRFYERSMYVFIKAVRYYVNSVNMALLIYVTRTKKEMVQLMIRKIVKRSITNKYKTPPLVQIPTVWSLLHYIWRKVQKPKSSYVTFPGPLSFTKWIWKDSTFFTYDKSWNEAQHCCEMTGTVAGYWHEAKSDWSILL